MYNTDTKCKKGGRKWTYVAKTQFVLSPCAVTAKDQNLQQHKGVKRVVLELRRQNEASEIVSACEAEANMNYVFLNHKQMQNKRLVLEGIKATGAH